jgi:hypothetical protein
VSTRRTVAVGTAYVAVWLGFALLIALMLFLQSSRTVTLASHDAVLSPDFSGRAVLHTGPVLPDLRFDTGTPIGVDIQLGKTDAPSTDALVERYALIASQPQGPADKLQDALQVMALDAVVKGAVLGLVPILLWLLIGRDRRRDLFARARTRQGGIAGLIVVLIAVGLWAPWEPDEDTVEGEREWITLQEFLGPAIHLPDDASGVEVQSSATTSETRRLIESAVETYDNSLTFYAAAEEAAGDIVLRTPEEGETVVALVSDRHDNIGMDAVARAVADQAGATAVFDAGDDTSTGSKWEAFSLDSVTAAFDDLDERWAVPGNHDNGSFVGAYLADRGWTVLDGEVVDGPADTLLLGVEDPRSSGLGTWRDEVGLSFEEVGTRLADEACAAADDGDRVTTILVHDANLGDEALERGCADLVLGGHLHNVSGPTAFTGENGEIGYSFTTGTTGGAAYAFSLGSKLRRPAQMSLITYAEDGTPVGIQSVTLLTSGDFEVDTFVELSY